MDGRFGDGGDTSTSIGPIGGSPHSLAIQQDGKIVVAGIGFNDFVLARYKGDPI